MRASQRRLRCGLTVDEYNVLLKLQNGVCGVCGNPPKSKRFHVDHDHRSGLVRGLLCFYCNYRVIGRHTLDKLRRAVAYLERYEVQNQASNQRLPSNPKNARRK